MCRDPRGISGPRHTGTSEPRPARGGKRKDPRPRGLLEHHQPPEPSTPGRNKGDARATPKSVEAPPSWSRHGTAIRQVVQRSNDWLTPASNRVRATSIVRQPQLRSRAIGARPIAVEQGKPRGAAGHARDAEGLGRSCGLPRLHSQAPRRWGRRRHPHRAVPHPRRPRSLRREVPRRSSARSGRA